jgi:tetratricopeptide (TPR) repeat protein
MLASEIVRDIEQALAVEEPARGLHLVDHLLQSFPAHLRARMLRAKALLALGESDEAAGDAATVLSADLLNVEAMLVRAKLAEAQGDLHQSHALIGRAASVDSGHSGVRQAVADSVAMLPRDPSALGFAYLNSNWPDLAEREFRVALGRDPARVDLRIALAESLWRQGRFDEARPECRIVLDHHPRCLRATLMMAHILAEQGRTAHGMEMLERAGEMDPEYEVAAELYARATLSRMSLPPPPSLPEPPLFPDDVVSTVEEPADAESDEAASDDEAGAEISGDSPAAVFTAMDETRADGDTDEPQPVEPAGDTGSDAGDPAGAAEVEESTPASPIDRVSDRDDEAADADEVETAPAVEFSAGCPAGPGQMVVADEVAEADEPEPASTMPASSVGEAEIEVAETEETQPEAVETVLDSERLNEEPSDPGETGPVEESVGADKETDDVDVPEPPAWLGSNADEPEIEPTAVGQPKPDGETHPDEAEAEPPGESGETGDADTADAFGGPAVLAMGRIGRWDAVVDALAKMLAGGEVEPVAGLIEELATLSGFPSSIWRLLGDGYMKTNRPQLASEAYFRAVRRNSE